MISGINTPGMITVPISGAVTEVHTPHTAGGHNSPVCIAVADLTAKAAVSTLTINAGTWNGAVFTSAQRIGFISVPANCTQDEWLFYVTINLQCIQIITTGDADTKAHVRVQGQLIKVA